MAIVAAGFECRLLKAMATTSSSALSANPERALKQTLVLGKPASSAKGQIQSVCVPRLFVSSRLKPRRESLRVLGNALYTPKLKLLEASDIIWLSRHPALVCEDVVASHCIFFFRVVTRR